MTIPLGPWRGINNVDAPDHASLQPPAQGQPLAFLREAVDVDLASDGWPRTRQGFESVAPLVDGRAIFAGAGLLLVQDGGSIVRLVPGDPAVKTVLVEGLDPELRAIFCAHFDQVYWSCGSQRGRIGSDGVARNWGCGVCPRPTLTAVAGGLPPGRYSVAATFIDAAGIEHGADRARDINLDGTQAIRATVAPLDQVAVQVRFYLAGPNNDRHYLWGDVAVSDLPAIISTLPQDDTECDRIGLGPPPGQISALISHNSTLIVATADGWVYPSLGPAVHLFEIGQARMQLSEPVVAGAGLKGGWWAVTEQDAYWIAGDDPFKWDPIPQHLGCGFAAGSAQINSALLPGLGLQSSTQMAVFVCDWGPAFGLPVALLMPKRGVYHVPGGAAGKRASFAYRHVNHGNARIAQLVFVLE